MFKKKKVVKTPVKVVEEEVKVEEVKVVAPIVKKPTRAEVLDRLAHSNVR